MLPRVVVFDLDETLTESKAPLTDEMAEILARLIGETKVAIASGGKFEIFKTQLFGRLPSHTRFENLHSLPTNASAHYRYENGEWVPVYETIIPEDEAKQMMEVMDRVARASGLIDYAQPSWGDRLEYRKSQVSLSALGQLAPVPEKKAWDPTMEKRIKLRDLLAEALPDYDVKRGGATTMDVVRPGINKAYGIRRLSEHLDIPIEQMIYIGDALFPGGNDEVVKETGIVTRQISGPDETAEVITELLSQV